MAHIKGRYWMTILNVVHRVLQYIFFFPCKAGLTVTSESTLTNPGLSDVCVRHDNRILATAGWDSRYVCMKESHIVTCHTLYGKVCGKTM